MIEHFFFEKTTSFDDLPSKIEKQSGLLKFVKLKQIHSATVVEFDKDKYDYTFEADACFTLMENLVLTIHTADCLPLLAYEGNVIGACHGGWRGIKAGIIGRWISKMSEKGAKVSQLKIVMGPAIGPCHFEVGEDVAKELCEINRKPLPDSVLKEVCLSHPFPKKKFIDLKKLAVYHLIGAGVLEKNITINSPCTFCEPDKYFSYRRDGAKGVRLESVIYRSK